MNFLGTTIYYEKSNGVVIWNKGEAHGTDITETTLEQDLEAVPTLQLIDPEQLGVVQLEYGMYKEEFNTCRGYKIDPINEVPIFIF